MLLYVFIPRPYTCDEPGISVKVFEIIPPVHDSAKDIDILLLNNFLKTTSANVSS